MKIRKISILFILISLLTLMSVARGYADDKETRDEQEGETSEKGKTKILGGKWLPVPVFLFCNAIFLSGWQRF
ncbi:MAG: hypothetical protein KAV87_59280 [Desulfobacteraceae bacterium]|nr:hypothetical protein [Desulfobacteraceae bacterium]